MSSFFRRLKKNRTRSKRERFRAFAEAYLDAANSTTYLNVYEKDGCRL